MSNLTPQLLLGKRKQVLIHVFNKNVTLKDTALTRADLFNPKQNRGFEVSKDIKQYGARPREGLRWVDSGYPNCQYDYGHGKKSKGKKQPGTALRGDYADRKYNPGHWCPVVCDWLIYK